MRERVTPCFVPTASYLFCAAPLRVLQYHLFAAAMDDIVELEDQHTAVNSPDNSEELKVDELDPSDSEAPTDMTRMLLKGTSRKCTFFHNLYDDILL